MENKNMIDNTEEGFKAEVFAMREEVTIDKKNLMIGDWVKDPIDNYVVWQWESCDYEDIEVDVLPIPITPEILEANGFVESEAINENLSPCDCLRYLYETDDGSYVCLDWVDSFDNGCGNELYMGWSEQWEMSVFGSNGYFEKRVKRRCFNVHELQHALRICGLNEIADNFKLK